MKLDPRHLEILAAIVEAGGLTEGAALVGKSQPSVSRSIAFLESRIGQPLFEPRRRPLRPTELGVALATEGKKILDANRTAAKLIQSFASGEAGAVRIAGTPIFMDGVISGVIAEFQAEFPSIRIDQSYAYLEEALDKIARDILDLAILPVRPDALGSDFEFRQILPGRNVIACRTGHPLTREAGLEPNDVVSYPWIAPPANSPLFQDLRAFLEGIGQQEVKIGFTGGSLSAVVNVLTGSDSLTVLPSSVVSILQSQNRLAVLPIKIGDPDRHLGVVSLKGGGKVATVQRFIEFVQTKFASPMRQSALVAREG